MRSTKNFSCRSRLSRCLSLIVLFHFFVLSAIPPGYAQSVSLPAVGALVPLSPGFQPAVLRGVQVDPIKHLELKFIVDGGQSGLKGESLEKETKDLVNYFLASLAIPEDDLWVNLSPYENDRVVPTNLGNTDMGRDLLAQDYLLKQVTASLLYPDDELGKKFWNTIYKKAYARYGTTNIPVNTFNKVWILPDTAKVYEEKDRAIITEARMKVMLEEDYLSKEKNLEVDSDGKNDKTAQLSSEIMREVVIPEIEKEVNEGKNFAKVRQIYYSLVLAHWFKTKLKGVLLNKIFADMSKVKGFEAKDPKEINKIYDQYVASFKKGVCNVLRIDYDTNEKKHVPRKYFSGGVVLEVETTPDTAASAITVLKRAATLMVAAFLFTFASLTTKAETSKSLDQGDKATTIEAITTTQSQAEVYDATGEFTDFEGPPMDSPLLDTIQQNFQQYKPFQAGDVILSGRGQSILEVAQVLPTMITNKGQKINVNVCWGKLTENGNVREVFFVQLQNPSAKFNQGHMTYSHSLHGLINAAKADPSFRQTLETASGKTLQQLEDELTRISAKDAVLQDHSFMNIKGIDNTRKMAIGAICFVAQGDTIVPVIIPIHGLDPIPFLGWEMGIKAIMTQYKRVESIEVLGGHTFNVKVNGSWRTVSTAQGPDAENLSGVVNLSRNFIQDYSAGNFSPWAADGQKLLLDFAGISQAANTATQEADGTISEVRDLASDLSQRDSTIFNILNLVFPNFLEQIKQKADEFNASAKTNITSAQGDLQDAYNQAQADISQDQKQLAYIGFLARLLNNPYVQKQGESFVNQLVQNSYAQAGGGVFEAGTNAQIQDVVNQINSTGVEFSRTNSAGKTETFSLNLRTVASLRYLFSLDAGLLAQGKVTFDETTENLLMELNEEANGTVSQGLLTLFEDLGNLDTSGLQEVFNKIMAGPSQGKVEGQVDMGLFIKGLVGGFQTACGEFGWKGEVKGLPMINVNVFGGAGGYGLATGTVDVKIHTQAEIEALLEESKLSGNLSAAITMEGGAKAYVLSGTSTNAGAQVFLPDQGISFVINYNATGETQIFKYANVKMDGGFSVNEQGVIGIDIKANVEYAVDKDLVTNDFSYSSNFDLGGIIKNLPGDVINKLNAWANQQQIGLDFWTYLKINCDFASAYNNFVPGSQNWKEGIKNLLTGVNTQYGLQEVLDVIEMALRDSYAQAEIDQVLKEISDEWQKKVDEINSEWQKGVKKSDREMTQVTKTTYFAFEFLKNFVYGKGKGFTTVKIGVGGPSAGVTVTTGGTLNAGKVNLSGSIQLNAATSRAVDQAASQSFIDYKTVLASWNIGQKDWLKIVSDVNRITNETIKDGTFYDNIERVRLALDQGLANVDSTVRICAIAALINNPQWRQSYNLDVRQLEANAFGLVKVQARTENGKFAGSLSVENYWEGDQGFAPYIGIGGSWNLEKKKILMSAAVYFDPMLGFTGAGLQLNLDGGQINVKFEQKITKVGVQLKIEPFYKMIKGKAKGPMTMLYNRKGAGIYDQKGELLSYVPLTSDQAKEIFGGTTAKYGKIEIKGSHQAERKAARNKIVNDVLDLMIEQEMDDVGVTPATAESASTNDGIADASPTAPSSSEKQKDFTKGGIAFDSRKIDMQIEGTGLEFDFPDNLITDEMRNLMGLVPQIINFQPVTNPYQLLGPLAKMEE